METFQTKRICQICHAVGPKHYWTCVTSHISMWILLGDSLDTLKYLCSDSHAFVTVPEITKIKSSVALNQMRTSEFILSCLCCTEEQREK